MDPLPPLPGEFTARLDDFEACLSKEPFFVLVWGSGRNRHEDYTKRVKILQHLRERCGENCVFLSEDERFQKMVSTYGQRVAEAAQVACVDAVVLLDTSIGPHSEALLYEPLLRSKAIVFTSVEHRFGDGFARTAFDLLRVEVYTPELYKDCFEIRRIANDFVQSVRYEKAKRGSLRRYFTNIM